MNSSIRSNLAATLMLLAPLGAGLVAQPVAAQHQRIAPVQPKITAMSLHSDAGLAPGATLRLQVRGTPGARSTIVTLGRSGVRVALREQGAGRYVGRYVVSRSDRIDPMQRMAVQARWGERIVAQGFSFPPAFQALAMGGTRQANGRVAPRDEHAARDKRAPRIFDVRPEHGDSLVDTGRAIRLSARLSDEGSGVDPGSVRLRIDGQDVTAGARVHGDELRYRDDLLRGRHTAELTVRDRAGNASRRVWTFDVV